MRGSVGSARGAGPWLAILLVILSGCVTPETAQNRQRIPATATAPAADPFFSGATGGVPGKSPPISDVARTASQGKDSRIPPTNVPETSTASGKATASASATNSGAKLLAPDTLSPGAANLASKQPAANAGDGAATGMPGWSGGDSVQQAQWNPKTLQPTIDELLERLRQRGAQSARLEWRDDLHAWVFSCELPSATNPQAVRLYEARDPVAVNAVRGVVDKLPK